VQYALYSRYPSEAPRPSASPSLGIILSSDSVLGEDTVASTLGIPSLPSLTFSLFLVTLRRVFGSSGLASPAMAAYALLHKDRSVLSPSPPSSPAVLSYLLRWRERIIAWQRDTQEDQSLPSYYRSQLFNELYFLVDGGSLWIDRQLQPDNQSPSLSGVELLSSLPSGHFSCLSSESPASPSPSLALGITPTQFQTALSAISDGLPYEAILQTCASIDDKIRLGHGDPRDVGRFLYLEGHEYLMSDPLPALSLSPYLSLSLLLFLTLLSSSRLRYNTYDVHFYAGFALLMVPPSLLLPSSLHFLTSSLSSLSLPSAGHSWSFLCKEISLLQCLSKISHLG
jgi:hypothetical protein